DRGGAGVGVGAGELGRLGDLRQGALGGAGALDLGDQAHGGAVAGQTRAGVEGRGGGVRARLDLGVRHGAAPGGEILADADDDVVENGSGGGHSVLLKRVGRRRARGCGPRGGAQPPTYEIGARNQKAGRFRSTVKTITTPVSTSTVVREGISSVVRPRARRSAH